MGAWGGGSFENDDALDWMGRLLQAADLSVVASTLEIATESSGYLLADEAAEVVAAAETAAALLGRPAPSLPPEVADWVGAHPSDGSERLALAATLALDVVENGSELRELWEEAGGDSLASWRAAVYDLRARLSP